MGWWRRQKLRMLPVLDLQKMKADPDFAVYVEETVSHSVQEADQIADISQRLWWGSSWRVQGGSLMLFDYSFMLLKGPIPVKAILRTGKGEWRFDSPKKP